VVLFTLEVPFELMESVVADAGLVVTTDGLVTAPGLVVTADGLVVVDEVEFTPSRLVTVLGADGAVRFGYVPELWASAGRVSSENPVARTRVAR
jgi:hypothetical protein